MYKLFRNRKGVGNLGPQEVFVGFSFVIFISFVGLIMFVSVMAATASEVLGSLQNLTDTGISLGTILSPTGIAGIVFGAVIFIVIVGIMIFTILPAFKALRGAGRK